MYTYTRIGQKSSWIVGDAVSTFAAQLAGLRPLAGEVVSRSGPTADMALACLFWASYRKDDFGG